LLFVLMCALWGTASILHVFAVPAAPWEFESTTRTYRRHLLSQEMTSIVHAIGAHLIILLNSATVNVPSNEPFRFMMLAMRLLVAAAQLRSDAEIFRSQAAVAVFAAPGPGDLLQGRLLWQGLGCKAEREMPEARQRGEIHLVQRGGCSFSAKSSVAARRGASAVVVADFASAHGEEAAETLVAGTSGGGRVPLLLLGSSFAGPLIEAAEAGEAVEVKVQLGQPAPSVVMDLWLPLGGVEALLTGLAPTARELSEVLRVHVHFRVVAAPEDASPALVARHCFAGLKELCAALVLQHRSIAPPAAPLLREAVYQHCLLRGFPQSYWWRYVEAARCNGSESCSRRTLTEIGLSTRDVLAVQRCASLEAASFLEDDRESASWGAAEEAALRINGWRYSGPLEAVRILRTICWQLDPSPATCQRFLNKDSDSKGGIALWRLVGLCLLSFAAGGLFRGPAATESKRVEGLKRAYVKIHQDKPVAWFFKATNPNPMIIPCSLYRRQSPLYAKYFDCAQTQGSILRVRQPHSVQMIKKDSPLFIDPTQLDFLRDVSMTKEFAPEMSVFQEPPGLGMRSELLGPPGLDLIGLKQILGTSPSGNREAVRYQYPPMSPMSPSPMSPLSPATVASVTFKNIPGNLPVTVAAPVSQATLRRDNQVQKRINQEIIAAAKAPKAEIPVKVLGIVEAKLDQMNGVNLSTAMHRLARACEGASQTLGRMRRNPVVLRMLDMVESLAAQELEFHDGTVPANCCTIISWSCASLRLFRTSVFEILVQVAVPNLKDCQPYEITNMMWALAELCRRHPQMGKDLQPTIQELVESAAAALFAHPEHLKLQVLISSLMSLTLFPRLNGMTQKMLLIRIVLDIANRDEELKATENLTPVLLSFDTMRKQHPQVYQEILLATGDRFPGFVAQYVLGPKSSRVKSSKRTQK
ncbi:BP80, partial [Symbiodinium pilosum]